MVITTSNGKIFHVNVQLSAEKKRLLLAHNARNSSVPRLAFSENAGPEPMPKIACETTKHAENEEDNEIISTIYRKKGRKYKVSSAPAGSPAHHKNDLNEESAEGTKQSPMSPRPRRPILSEIEHWKEISTRINSILDKRLVWVPESELIRSGASRLVFKRNAREEAARIKLTHPKYINTKSKVRLYNMQLKLTSGRRGSDAA